MKLGIALGGGSAKGYAHLGIIKTLSENGFNFDVVTGTSIGAFVGAVYAGGGLKELEEISRDIKLKDLPKILSPTFSKTGLLSGNYIKTLLNRVIDAENIEDLSIPYAAVSTDINKGETVTFTSGSLYKAIRASIAIPGLFTPVIDGDRFLVDGGALDPVPVEAAKDLGADKIIAVDLIRKHNDFSEDMGTQKILKDLPFHDEFETLAQYFKSLGESLYIFESENKGIFAQKTVADIIQRISIVTQSRLVDQSFKINPPDLVIRPDTSEIGIMDFHKAERGIEIGVEIATKLLPKIKEIIKQP